MSTNFSTASASIKAANFGHFLVFVRGRDCPQLSRDRVAAFLFISTQLGNDPLVLDLLSSLEPAAVSSNVSPSADSATKQKLFGEMTIDACALQFDFYPAEDILLLYCQTLHRLVSSPLLTIESEDCLLRLLLELELELGFDRFEFLGWIEISLFFQKMAVRFFWTTSAWRRFLRTFGRQLFLI